MLIAAAVTACSGGTDESVAGTVRELVCDGDRAEVTLDADDGSTLVIPIEPGMRIDGALAPSGCDGLGQALGARVEIG